MILTTKTSEYVCMYVCMCVYMDGHQMQQGKDQPGKVANPARSAEQGKLFFPSPRSRLRSWSRETGSALPSRVLTYGIPPDFRGGVHIFI